MTSGVQVQCLLGVPMGRYFLLKIQYIRHALVTLVQVAMLSHCEILILDCYCILCCSLSQVLPHILK